MATRKTARKKATVGTVNKPKVVETPTTVITFRSGPRSIVETWIIKPNTDGGVNVETPCGSGEDMPKEIAIAVANAVLKMAQNL